MFELKKAFSINDVIVDRNVEDKDFAIVELWSLASGQNSHRNPISTEVLERDADSFKGKFIIGQYDEWINDVKGHEVKENIYGYVSLTDEPQFKTKVVEGIEKEFVVVKGVLSKIYAKEIVDLFKVDTAKSVSCEFSCSLQYDEDEYGRPIDEYGNPMDCDNPILGYSISGITILGRKIRPSVKGAEIVMKRFSEDTNKLEIASKEELMEENKKFSEESKDEDIVMQEEPNQQEVDNTKGVKGDDKVDEVPTKEESAESVELAEEEAPKAEEKEDKEEVPTKEESAEEAKEEMSEEEPKADDAEAEKEDEKEMACGTEEMACGDEDKAMEEVKEEAEDDKSFAEQAVECAEEEDKEFVEKLFSSELKDMVAEVVKMKKFMDATVKAETEKRFSEIMVEPKICLGQKAYNVLFEEGSQLSLSELDAFEQKVKAFCEDSPKKPQKEEEILVFSCGDTDNNVGRELTVDELIKKYNN